MASLGFEVRQLQLEGAKGHALFFGFRPFEAPNPAPRLDAPPIAHTLAFSDAVETRAGGSGSLVSLASTAAHRGQVQRAVVRVTSTAPDMLVELPFVPAAIADVLCVDAAGSRLDAAAAWESGQPRMRIATSAATGFRASLVVFAALSVL
jgi:hypothetical protein